jgi:REP element-mobilizing transposase RayT
MAQTLSCVVLHIIFSTKGRIAVINDGVRSELMAYLGSLIREKNGKALAVNGTADHVHLLVQIPPALSISELMRFVKTNSSRWTRRVNSSMKDFEWQHGYGVFSVSRSNAQKVCRYILNQEAHHKKRSFQEEFLSFLERYEVDYDERYLWD